MCAVVVLGGGCIIGCGVTGDGLLVVEDTLATSEHAEEEVIMAEVTS